MTNKHLESISALLDDEVNQSELENALQQTSEKADDVDVFTRYSLIGDVMRNEQVLETNDSFAASIQAAIANVEQEVVEENTETEKSSVVDISTHANWRSRMTQKVKDFGQSSSGRSSAQFAIAASVALVAIIGVNNMSQSNSEYSAPVAQTTPLVSGVAPVSLGSTGVQNKPSASQMTQSRINALIADHQQQLKVIDDKKAVEEINEDKKVIEP
ncbi:RseA family anti-sigma factor [uncultured Psychrosphaera sp.]|uniref:sigma-E factor negative regulatory protein n=1 Tax=uncultured Psychrosphaera sp. TaxID=1403522 RepID=UPI002630F665|nr:RseA family anti-sigma factor [uncultured Psychrosphaera sp.]